MIRGPKKQVSILLPLDLYEALAARAQKNSRSLSSYLRLVLKHHLCGEDKKAGR